MRVTWNSGQTIIEVIIAAAIVGLVVTAVAAGLTFSIKNSAEARFKGIATTQAQEVIEVLRRERILLGWEDWKSTLGAGIFCLNTLPADTAAFTSLQPGQCESGTAQLGTEFTRELESNLVSTDQVTATVRVKWYDGATPRQVEVVQEFKKWE